MKELRNLSKISFMQSERDIINVQIKGLTLQNKYMEIDIKDTVRNIKRQKQFISYSFIKCMTCYQIIHKIFFVFL